MSCCRPLSGPSASVITRRETFPPEEPYALVPSVSCGQLFRFDCAGAHAVTAVCGDVAVSAVQTSAGITVSSVAASTASVLPEVFLGIDDDIAAMATESRRWLEGRYPGHVHLIRDVFRFSAGVHLLRQPVLETVVGYLLSVQSTVALVGNRLDRIARLFPSQCTVLEGRELYFFPTAQQLRSIPSCTLAALHLGYRQKWLEHLLEHLPDEQQLTQLASVTARERQEFFRRFEGIGPKVAACVDLFAYGNFTAFPIDVWVERGLHDVLGLCDAEIVRLRRDPSSMLGPWCGLFGEYLFRYERDRRAR